MTFLLYDRFFSLDRKSGIMQTFWRVIGDKCNSIVQLHERYATPSLNCFSQNIASLYIFCKPSQCIEFEKRQLLDIHKQFATNIKIFKYEKHVTLSISSSTLSRNLDNIQNIFMMHTCDISNIDAIESKEPVSTRVLYKICFNAETARSSIISRIQIHNLTQYPDIELFVPFDDECEIFLSTIFPTNRYIVDSKYTYMSVVAAHYLNMVGIRNLTGLVQLVHARKVSNNILSVTSKEPIISPRIITDMFLEHVPIVDVLIGRVYENEQCYEFNSSENEITFIIIKIYAKQRLNFVTFVNVKYQQMAQISHSTSRKNILVCNDETEMLNSFYNLYTNNLIFDTLDMDVHFILATQRYKSSSYMILLRIIIRNLWKKFAPHCVVSEDGKCVRLNNKSILLFDNVDSSSKIVTNFGNIENNMIYLPEVYADSTMPFESSLEDHIANVRVHKMAKYKNIPKQLDQSEIVTLSLYDMICIIFKREDCIPNTQYNLILESIIELSEKIRIPITLLYSLSVAQIAYRLIFYNSLRNGTFLLMDRQEKMPHFYQSCDTKKTTHLMNNITIPKQMNIYQMWEPIGTDTQNVLQSITRKYIPSLMHGNIVGNYFNYFCPVGHHFPIVSSLVDNEEELLSIKNVVLWSRRSYYINRSIASFDFSLYNSSLIALFDIDFGNCAILYGFELKTFYHNIYASAQSFNDNTIEILQLPYTFIMNNETLKIHNIKTYECIDELQDYSCYIVIMRFMLNCIYKQFNHNYKSLSNLFMENIHDINKYKTRLALHKNILNSICGMLSAYNINTTILNIVNALSRKIILWTVDNCINDEYPQSTILEHEYDVNSIPPTNLLAIENDSFTFIYSMNRLNYDTPDENTRHVEDIRENILKRLSTELTKCTMYTYDDIRRVINLKVNFVTGNLYQLSARTYYFIQSVNGILEFRSNEHNDVGVNKSLFYLNRNKRLIEQIKRGNSIRISYLKDTYNLIDIRRLLIWYMMQLPRARETLHSNTDFIYLLSQLNTLNNFITKEIYQDAEVTQHVDYLLNIIRLSNVDEYFRRIICSPVVNINFQIPSIPDKTLYEHISIPSDKRSMVHNCVEMFFKLYIKARSLRQQTTLS